MFKIQITSHRIVTDSYALFKVSFEVEDPLTAWNVEKRYSELRKLHEELSLYHSNLPEFPPKYFFDNLGEERLKERQTLLNNYFTELSKRTDIFGPRITPIFLLKFFNTPREVIDVYGNATLEVKRSTELFMENMILEDEQEVPQEQPVEEEPNSGLLEAFNAALTNFNLDQVGNLFK
ncbi:hypothetical protein ABK040_004396 [Willaertia magna]